MNTSPFNTCIQKVTNFNDLINFKFHGDTNAVCWERTLDGDFSEIINKIKVKENLVELGEEELLSLELSLEGNIAREIILNDLQLLKLHGALPSLNIINYYTRDIEYSCFPTDVYSFHVDRSPIASDTILCTYFGESSELIPNNEAEQKIHVPEIRAELKKLYNGPEENFESFLIENFFDLHYRIKPTYTPIKLGIGNLWKLAVDYPESKVAPCIHRAPIEKNGQNRLLLIC